MKNHASTVIWSDSHGTGRHVFVQFRRRFDLSSLPDRAELHLFGDTRYRLRVNGTVANYGPARFAPAHPEADSVDVSPWLRRGANEILVEVNQRGAPSYEHAPSSGGFVAWGRIGDHDLATPGAWECRRCTAWDGDAMTVSFAQGPLECCDTRCLDDGAWQTPVARDRQDAWGDFRPRSIPLLGMQETGVQRLLGAYALRPVGLSFGFRISGPATQAGSRRRAPYACCIHSPTAQSVTVALFWGPHLLNGVELACRTHPALGNRQDAELALRAGWNLLYGEPEVMAAGWTPLFALPEDRGLTVSAHPRLDDPCILRHGVSMPEDELARRRGAMPTACEHLPDLGWTLVERSAAVPGPSHQPGWDEPATRLDLPPHQLTDLKLPAGSHAVVCDLGREYLGHIQVELSAPAGCIIDVTSCERVRADGLLHPFAFHWQFNETDRFVARGGRQSWEGFNPRGGRYLQITVRDAGQQVTLHRLAVRETVYPIDSTASFACSDAFLTWLWQAGAATLRACAEDSFIDCPSRERGLYTWDTVVEHHVMRALTTDRRLIRRCLWLYAVNQRPDGQLQDVTPAHKPSILGDFSLYWVLGVHDYLERSGDASLLDEIWPHLVRLLDSPTWICDGDGLLDSDRIATAHPDVVLIARVPGLNGVLNVIWAMALDRAARLAGATGRPAAAAWRERADRVHAALHRRLWLADAGCFAHAIQEGRPAGDPLRATVLAMAFDLTDAAQTAAGMALLERRMADSGLPPLGPQDAHIVLLACRRAGRSDLAERWLHRAFASNLHGGAWTLWEHTTANTSLCHAWSAGGVWWLSDETLGASWEPSRPDEVVVAPDSATLTWAAGVVPHPAGPLRIAWRIHGDDLHLDVDAPAGVHVTRRPRGRLAGYRMR